MAAKSTVPTIDTIAKHVGVSKSTVSRVLHGGEGIGADAIRRVQGAIIELKYRPNRLASQLAMGGSGRAKSYVIECIWFFPRKQDFENNVLRSDNDRAIFASIWAAASKKNYSLIVDFVDANNLEPKLPTLMGRNVADGLIVFGSVPPAWLEQASRLLPVVSLQQFSPLSRHVPAVNCNYRDGVHRVVQHLVGHGHKRIAFFCIADPIDGHLEMINGYKQGMSELGGRQTGELLATPGRTESETLEDICSAELDRWWAMRNRPTAIIATEVYLGPILRILQARGVRVPQDVSLFSLSGGTEKDRITDAFFSRLDIPQKDMAVVAVNQLLARIDGYDGPCEVIMLPMGFVESKSVAPPSL
jgi:LacI family transcriptional regulator